MDTRSESEFANPDLEILITSEQVADRIRAIGAEMALDYAGKSPLFIGLLPSAGFFLSDLVRGIDIPLGIEFMAIDNGIYSPGEIRILKDLDVAIEGRHVVVVQVLVDTGFTESYLLPNLKSRGAASVKLVSLLDNFELREKEVPIDYLGFAIPNLTVVGYGLGLAARYRNLPYLAVVKGVGRPPIPRRRETPRPPRPLSLPRLPIPST